MTRVFHSFYETEKYWTLAAFKIFIYVSTFIYLFIYLFQKTTQRYLCSMRLTKHFSNN
jgi:hypothetical protein